MGKEGFLMPRQLVVLYALCVVVLFLVNVAVS